MQYRQFEMIEEYLENPRVLQTQFLFPLSEELSQSLINSYYGYDEKVIRELLGKKLTQRIRKELDDVSQKTRVPINGCRRMFDNLKRIQKRVEDIEGPTSDIIIQYFLIPRELAARYANIVYNVLYRCSSTTTGLTLQKSV
jgi:Acidic fibroblast growth factor binding (FIBP)